MRVLVTVLFLTSACVDWPETVGLFAVVTDAPYNDGDGIGGADVTVLDESLTVYSQATTSEDGSFYADVAAAQAVFIEVSADGYASTHFGGEIGIIDVEIGSGVLFTVLEDEMDELTGDFGDCVGQDETAATVVGEVRMYLAGIQSGDMPLESNVTVTVYDAVGNAAEACYLDADGVYDPEAEFTGATGRFGVFDLPAGALTIEVVTWMQTSKTSEPYAYGAYYYFRYVSEGGIAPLYPALTEG
jgi:hypothetical protein